MQMKLTLFFFLLTLLTIPSVFAQKANALKTPADSLMITIFLKHQQDKNLKQLQEIQAANKLWEHFPPKEARVVSWYVMMGIGQVVTVKIPGHALRALNLAIENGAWGAFSTEFYPTYDFRPIWQNNLQNKK